MGNRITIEELRKEVGVSEPKKPIELLEAMKRNLAEYDREFHKALSKGGRR